MLGAWRFSCSHVLSKADDVVKYPKVEGDLSVEEFVAKHAIPWKKLFSYYLMYGNIIISGVNKWCPSWICVKHE